MTTSADERRQRTTRAISDCARRLTAQHGLDGFTMDDLAECVGVSRRTLFNYVPGKIDAVIGVDAEPDPALAATFLSGGPTGHLLTDVKELVLVLLAAGETTPAEVDQIRRLLRSDTRLLTAVHERFVEITDRFAEAIALREGNAVDPLTVRVIAQVTISLFDIALDESLRDSELSLAEHFDRVFDTTLDLIAPTPT